jgi:hypothetical protein
MVFNTTFNNISAFLWQLVLLVEETGVNLPQVTDKLKLIEGEIYFIKHFLF